MSGKKMTWDKKKIPQKLLQSAPKSPKWPSCYHSLAWVRVVKCKMSTSQKMDGNTTDYSVISLQEQKMSKNTLISMKISEVTVVIKLSIRRNGRMQNVNMSTPTQTLTYHLKKRYLQNRSLWIWNESWNMLLNSFAIFSHSAKHHSSLNGETSNGNCSSTQH